MRQATKTAVLVTMLAAGTALADGERSDPNSIARGQTMKDIGAAMKVLGGMAGGDAAFDAASAQAAKDAMTAAAAGIATSFAVQGEADEGTKAKPEIWTNWEDFTGKAAALSTALASLDVSSAQSIGAGMGPIGGACKACHSDYKQ